MPRKKSVSKRTIALARIDELFCHAILAFGRDHALSDRYVELARKIAMKSKVKISPRYKRLFCHKCYRFLMPGINCRVRTTTKTITYYCGYCKNFNRYSYKREKYINNAASGLSRRKTSDQDKTD